MYFRNQFAWINCANNLLQGLPEAAGLSQVGETGGCSGNTPSVGALQRMGHQVKGLSCYHCTVRISQYVQPSVTYSHVVGVVAWMLVWQCSCLTATTQMLRFVRWLSGSWRRWRMMMCSGIFSSLSRCVFSFCSIVYIFLVLHFKSVQLNITI